MSGGSAVYVLAYAVFYFFTKLEITEFIPTLLYVGYTGRSFPPFSTVVARSKLAVNELLGVQELVGICERVKQEKSYH